MADKERYTSGPQTIVSMPVESATVIYKGDHVALDGGYCVPFNLLNDSGDAAANRETAADMIIGIAQTASVAGETDRITVDIGNESVHTFTLQTSATLSFAHALEPYSDGGACDAQEVVAGTTSPIAYTVEESDTGTNVKGILAPQAKLRTAQS